MKSIPRIVLAVGHLYVTCYRFLLFEPYHIQVPGSESSEPELEPELIFACQVDEIQVTCSYYHLSSILESSTTKSYQ